MGPGHSAPTVAEQAWIDACKEFGCVACFLDGAPGMPGAYHHIVEGNRRLGHRYGFCLCDPGHHQNGAARGLISLHPGRSPKFIALYGTERSLLARLERRLGFPHALDRP